MFEEDETPKFILVEELDQEGIMSYNQRLMKICYQLRSIENFNETGSWIKMSSMFDEFIGQHIKTVESQEQKKMTVNQVYYVSDSSSDIGVRQSKGLDKKLALH